MKSLLLSAQTINSVFLPDCAPVSFKFLSGMTKKMILLYCDLQSEFPFMKQWLQIVRLQGFLNTIHTVQTSGDNGYFYDVRNNTPRKEINL